MTDFFNFLFPILLFLVIGLVQASLLFRLVVFGTARPVSDPSEDSTAKKIKRILFLCYKLSNPFVKLIPRPVVALSLF
jgi:hypothetical protein